MLSTDNSEIKPEYKWQHRLVSVIHWRDEGTSRTGEIEKSNPLRIVRQNQDTNRPPAFRGSGRLHQYNKIQLLPTTTNFVYFGKDFW